MSFLYVTFSAYASALQSTCSFVFIHWACEKDCFTGPQKCHQGAEFKNTITSEEAAVCISYGIAAKSFGWSYG